MSIPAPVSEPVDATQARPGSDSKDVELQTLLEEATEAILDKRYDEALLLLRRAQEIAPNNDRVVANLERLEALRVEDKEKE
jgi:Flp pilus assembly protein TadD